MKSFFKKLNALCHGDVVGAILGIAVFGFGLFVALMPLMPSLFVSPEAASNEGRWIITLFGLLIMWVAADVHLLMRYVNKHGVMPPYD